MTHENGQQRPLRCLLVSAVGSAENRDGDAHYAADLVRFPPEGVTYVRYTDAAAAGEVELDPRLRSLETWRAPRARLPAAVARGGLHLARRHGLLLPEAVRWIRVRGQFDVVHVHGMPVRFLGPRPPVLLSDPVASFWYWSSGCVLPEERVHRLLRREGVVARRLGYLHPAARPVADRVVLFVEPGIDVAERIGVDVRSATVCAPCVPAASHPARGDGRTLLFVARSFALKGGEDALRVLELVREQIPGVRLLVAGPEDGPATLPPGVEWLGRVSRERLYDDVYPRADVFLYPTRVDGAPLVVQEALAHGLPVIAPAIMGLPGLVRHEQTGYLLDPWDVRKAAAAVVALLGDPVALRRLSVAAVADHEQRFSIRHRKSALGAVYRSLAS